MTEADDADCLFDIASFTARHSYVAPLSVGETVTERIDVVTNPTYVIQHKIITRLNFE